MLLYLLSFLCGFAALCEYILIGGRHELTGLDVGSTGCKAIVFDLDGTMLGQAYREYPFLHPEPGWIELDPNHVWQCVQDVIREVSHISGKQDPIKAVAISCIGEAVTPLDQHGQPLCNSILGFDIRGEEESRRLETALGKETIFQITGRPLNLMFSINKILWLRKHRPEILQQASKLLLYGDYIAARLGLTPMIGYSSASTTMALDLLKGCWSEVILKEANLTPDLLAIPKPAGEIIGEIPVKRAESLGLTKGVKLVTGGHDQPCGALGSGVVHEGLAMDGTGTVECITPAFERAILNDQMLTHNFCCAPHVVPGLFTTLAFNFTGGSLLRWYRDTFGSEEIREAELQALDVYEILLNKASTEPSSVLVLPHFTVTGTPWFDPDAKGAIVGLSLGTTKGEIIKGILDGITYEMKFNLELLHQAGVDLRELRAIGGGAKSRFWLQLKANILNVPVHSLKVSEASCLGAAILAGAAISEFSSMVEAADHLVKIKETFDPDATQVSLYQEKYEIYRDLYSTLVPITHRL